MIIGSGILTGIAFFLGFITLVASATDGKFYCGSFLMALFFGVVAGGLFGYDHFKTEISMDQYEELKHYKYSLAMEIFDAMDDNKITKHEFSFLKGRAERLNNYKKLQMVKDEILEILPWKGASERTIAGEN